jgi:hypothetical protein
MHYSQGGGRSGGRGGEKVPCSDGREAGASRGGVGGVGQGGVLVGRGEGGRDCE